MSHARYLVDEYTVDVQVERDKIEVKDPQGNLVVGKYLKMIKEDGWWDVWYNNKSQDLMVGNSPFYAPHQAGALNRILHQHNAQEFGNFNAPYNIGIYLDDIPENNILKILDKNGKPIEGAKVKIFQSIPANGEKTKYGEKLIDNIPDFEGTTDFLGIIPVGPNPFGNTTLSLGAPWNKKIYPSGNNSVFILEVFYNDIIFYKFMEVSDFNIAYWSGFTNEAVYEVQTDIPIIIQSSQRNIQQSTQVTNILNDTQNQNNPIYQMIAKCFKEKANTPSCPDKNAVDYDKDGDVDEQDYKLFLQSLGQ